MYTQIRRSRGEPACPWRLLASACTVAWMVGAGSPGLAAAGPAHDPARIPPATAPSARPGDPIGDTWTADVFAEIEAMEYEPSICNGVLQVPNRRQNLRLRFRPDGIDIRRRVGAGSDWRFSWRPLAWGRPGSMHEMSPSAPQASDATVRYVREGIVEWYENRPDGVEQGFTITRRPAGDGPLVVTASVAPRDGAPALEVIRDPDGAGVEVRTETGARVLRYDGLHVIDARGRALDAHLELASQRISILVDDAGAEYPVVIDPLITTPALILETEHPGAFYGAGLATAGDVNGDGYSDVIIGAPDYDAGIPDQGKVYVHFGTPDGPNAVADWTATGGTATVRLGTSVSTAGDVNGDGYDDIVVGAADHSSGQIAEGWVLAWYGSSLGLGDPGTLANADFVVEGDTQLAQFGYRVSTAGDVNGDGYDEIIVGAHLHSGTFTREGRASVYYGSSTGLNAITSWHVHGGQDEARLGADVRGAGDVNGDGYDDVIVGAPGIETGGGAVLGAAYVWLGSASGLSAFPTPATADWTASDGLEDTAYGAAVAGVGDVNGDGYADVLVGAPAHDNAGSDQGTVFLYPGTAGGPALLPTWQWSTLQDGALTGTSISTAGDVNGDGHADVVIGAPEADSPTTIGIGGAYVFEGRASGLPTEPASEVFGTTGLGAFASSVACGGDVNGDGYGDVLVAQPHDDGAVFLYFGEPAGLSSVHTIQLGGSTSGSSVGWSVASAGDVNGDGFSDVIVGAPSFDNGEVDEGVAGVYLGSPDGITNAGFWLAESNQAGAQLGYDVHSAGDVNADGYADVIVGARLYTHHEAQEGAAFVWHGSASGLGAFGTPANADWAVYGGRSSAELGSAVAAAGDVDGDGAGDVVVGAPGRAEARVYYARPGVGLPVVASWTAVDPMAGSAFGWDVACAGDVNRDGYSDVLIGAPLGTDDPVLEDGEGRAYLWYGASTGLRDTGSPSGANWRAESNQAFAAFGVSVASAGDVNGDAYADLIIGASLYDPGPIDTGAAWIWYGSPTGPGLGTPGGADWEGRLNQPDASFGYSVDGAGDVNADGYGDVLIGSWAHDETLANEGRVVCYLGGPSGPSTIGPDWTVDGGLLVGTLGYSVAGAGDVNGDGFADVLAGAPSWDDGGAFQGGIFRVYQGAAGGGIDRPVLQLRFGDLEPVHALGVSDIENGFRFRALARTPAGRGHVRLEWEVEPLAIPFDGAGLGQSPAFLDTGAPVSGEGSSIALGGIVSGLSPGFVYHWRLRYLSDSPYFPHSPWISLAGLTRNEMAIRMDGVAVDVAGGPADVDMPPSARLAVAPHPIRSAATISFVLERGGSVRLAVHDVSGRRVVTLLDGYEAAGPHAVAWDGATSRGLDAGAGVYFLRLTGSEMRPVTRRLVVVR